MGVYLRLLPLLGPGKWAAHNMILLERRRELWPAIDALDQRDIPEPIRCFLATGPDGDPTYGGVEHSPYGDLLKWTTVEQLMTLYAHDAVRDNWDNRAAWAYLKEMPVDWPIVLYWH